MAEHLGLPHKCVHEEQQRVVLEMNKQIRSPWNSQDEEDLNNPRRRLSGTFDSIRITVDSSRLNTLISDTTRRNFIVNLVNSAVTFYQKRLKVERLTSSIVYSSTTCGAQTVPSTPSVPNSDYHFFVTAENSSTQQYLAYATFCLVDGSSGRPVVGLINYNVYYMTDLSGKSYQQWMDTTLHEMAHALVFSSQLFGSYINPLTSLPYGSAAVVDQTVRGLTTSHLVTPKVKAWAQSHYNCSSAIGMQLENQGSSGSKGSHWERTVAYDELMTASRLGPKKSFTGLTWAAFEDSSWYQVDSSHADTLLWGYQQGCNFFTQGCLASNNASFKEFCSTQGTYSCGHDRSSRAICLKTNLEAYFVDASCGIMIPVESSECIDPDDEDNDGGATYQKQTYALPDSRCFVSSLGGGTSKCYDQQCLADGTLQVNLGSTSVICTTEGQQFSNIADLQGVLICPDVAKICSQGRKYCSNWCGNKGYCMGGICNCLGTAFGRSCERTDCTSGQFIDQSGNCVSSCSTPGQYGNIFNRYCENCFKTCNTCTGGESNQCLTCKSGYKFFQSQCLDACPAGYYADASSVCQICNGVSPGVGECTECVTSASYCTKCKTSTYFIESGVCKDKTTCTSTYKDQDAKLCLSSCINGKLPDTSNNCIKCASGTYYNSGLCVATCPDGKYKNNDTNVCSPCNSRCQKCTGPNFTQCQTCATGYFLFQQTCGTECPSGSFEDSTNNACTQCHPNCTDCIGALVTQCKRCVGGYVLEISDAVNGIGKCVTQCTDISSFANHVTKLCQQCDSTCHTCSKEEYDQCLSCSGGSFLLTQGIQKKCVASCPDGYYENATDNSCIKCHSSCKTCTGQQPTECIDCKNTTVKFTDPDLGDVCVTQCPSGYYKFDDGVNDPYCQDCHSSCEQCDGPNDDDCLSCVDPTYLYNKTCVEICPPGIEPDDVMRECYSGRLLLAPITILILILINI